MRCFDVTEAKGTERSGRNPAPAAPRNWRRESSMFMP